jgi:peptide deformylase
VAVRSVVRYPDARLKAVCEPLLGAMSEGEPLPARVLALAHDLVDTMATFPGCVGVAAPQLGELHRMAAIDVRGHKKARSCQGLLVLVDPQVVASSGSVVMREGCLSIPDFTGNVRRAEEVRVRARCLSLDGGTGPGTGVPARLADAGWLEFDADAYEARVVLHELDHLEGLLFLDRVDSARDVFPRKTYK